MRQYFKSDKKKREEAKRKKKEEKKNRRLALKEGEAAAPEDASAVAVPQDLPGTEADPA